jgi:hypothetical protein
LCDVIRAALAACFVSVVAVSSAAGIKPLAAADGLARTTTFEDATGEDPQGPDITSVAVTADEDRLLTFRVSIPSRPVLTEDMRVRIWLDLDDDRTTGLTVERLAGFDYFLLVDRWELGLGMVGVFSCSGNSCGGGPGGPWGEQTSLRFSYANGATFSVDAAELGSKRLERIRFSVETTSGVAFDPLARRYDFTNAHQDFAPEEGGSWTYESRALLVKSFSATPATPRAGKPFALRLTAVRTDTGAVLARGKVSCSFMTAGRTLKPRAGGFVGRRAVCVFVVPMGTKGQRFRSSLSVRVRGNSIARSLSGTIG